MKRQLADQLIGDLEAEVNNGGLDPYFFNASGDRTEETIRALRLIGAAHTAEIVSRAAALFPGGAPSANRHERQRQLELVSPDGDAFEALDRAFLAYQDDLASLMASYRSGGGA